MIDPDTFSNKELISILAERLGVPVDDLAALAGVPIVAVVDKKEPSIHWKAFKDYIEACETKPFNSVFGEMEKEAVSYIVNVFIDEGYTDLRLLAYALATVRAECGSKMMPVREGFAATDEQARRHVLKHNREYAQEIDGQVYYGRGYVQLTWWHNYKAENIHRNPDKALEPEFAAKLLFKGLLDGRWNGKGKGLMYYLDKGDSVEARRTVNVLNKADWISELYNDFYNALLLSYDD